MSAKIMTSALYFGPGAHVRRQDDGSVWMYVSADEGGWIEVDSHADCDLLDELSSQARALLPAPAPSLPRRQPSVRAEPGYPYPLAESGASAPDSAPAHTGDGQTPGPADTLGVPSARHEAEPGPGDYCRCIDRMRPISFPDMTTCGVCRLPLFPARTEHSLGPESAASTGAASPLGVTVPGPGPGVRSFDDLLADPLEQLDSRGEIRDRLLASIAEHREASGLAASSSPQPSPGPVLAPASTGHDPGSGGQTSSLSPSGREAPVAQAGADGGAVVSPPGPAAPPPTAVPRPGPIGQCGETPASVPGHGPGPGSEPSGATGPVPEPGGYQVIDIGLPDVHLAGCPAGRGGPSCHCQELRDLDQDHDTVPAPWDGPEPGSQLAIWARKGDGDGD